jgi:hypothetical protein
MMAAVEQLPQGNGRSLSDAVVEDINAWWRMSNNRVLITMSNNWKLDNGDKTTINYTLTSNYGTKQQSTTL